MTQTLTLKDGLARLREAMKAGTLAIQNGKDRCQYDYGDGVHCAIGAMFEEETLAKVRGSANNSFNLPRLVRDGILKVSSDTDVAELHYLQLAHDDEIHEALKGEAEKVANFEAAVARVEKRNGLLP